MNAKKNYFDLKGKNAESLVHELALKTFLTDWCYLNPLLPSGKELCDLLVVFDQVAIIWQIKDLKLDAHGHYKEAEVNKNLRQLAGARRQLFDLKTPIELKNPRRAKEVLDPSSIDEIYLISVLMGKGEELFSFIELIKTYTAHVFTRDFTQIVLTELDTISDFTAYLRDKDSVVQQNRHIMIQGGEEELLAFYLLNGRSFARFEEATAILIDDGSWQHFQEGKQYIAKKKEDEISYGWDYIINRVNEGFANYEPIARELARPTRFQRRVLSKGFFDAQLRAHADDTANVYRRVMPFEGVTYCFLFCAEGPSNETREKMLEATCRVARGRFQENTIVLGIATEKHIAPECSYSFCLLELPEWTDESQALMDEIQREFGILVDPSLTEVEEREYPS